MTIGSFPRCPRGVLDCDCGSAYCALFKRENPRCFEPPSEIVRRLADEGVEDRLTNHEEELGT